MFRFMIYVGRPDAGYDSEEKETQVDIIYEDQDIRTVSIKEALQKREFQLDGNSEDPSETFELRKIRVRPRKSRVWKKRHRPPEVTVISPKGQSIQNAVVEIQNRKQSGRNTRARAAKTKAARKTSVEQRRRAQEGEKRIAFRSGIVHREKKAQREGFARPWTGHSVTQSDPCTRSS